MIEIIAYEYGSAVKYLKERLDASSIDNEVVLTSKAGLAAQSKFALTRAQAIIFVGDSVALKNAFAENFGLATFYDENTKVNVRKYCLSNGIPFPPQYAMDNLCAVPETFRNYPCNFGLSCGCSGEYNKCSVYILPDNIDEVKFLFGTYIAQTVEKLCGAQSNSQVFKIFGLSEKEIAEKTSTVTSKFVSCKLSSENLDSKLTLIFRSGIAQQLRQNAINTVRSAFEDYIYAESDVTLAQTVVATLKEIRKKVAVAESLTGGLVTDKLVEVPGASSVLYEGLVTYTVPSKCERLLISPHFVDRYGVVSKEVAHEMAKGLLRGEVEFSVSTTGYAGPDSSDGQPVGLCFIGVGSPRGIKVYRNMFSGDRQQIRLQAANSALYLLYRSLITKQ